MQALIVDSITHVPAQARGGVVVCASHGGSHAARCALFAGVRSVVFSDAGIGKARAGVAGLDLLDRHAVAAVAVSHRSARIGDGADVFRRGVVSCANELARSAGVRVGMSTLDAWTHLVASEHGSERQSPEEDVEESRRVVSGYGAMKVFALDSTSLVGPQDVDAVVVTASHGGLLGGDPRSAIKANVFAAVFNDADVGIDDAGIGRLPALNQRGIAAVTVSAWSARIGDGNSALEEGTISHANAIALRDGVRVGDTTRQFLDVMAEAWTRRRRPPPPEGNQ